MSTTSKYSWQRTQAPKEEAVTLGEVKGHLVIDDDITEDDALLEIYIGAAARHMESSNNLVLTTQKWTLFFDSFPCEIRIPRRPVQAVDAIKYIDSSGAMQTLAANQYQTDLTLFQPRICPAYGLSWPTTRCQYKAVQVELTLGYGAAAQVPEPLRNALLLLIGHLYQNRENTINQDFALTEIPLGYKALLASEAMVHF